MNYTIDQVREYVEGWLGADSDLNNLTINQVKAMLHNSLVMLEDYQDGIEYYVERTKLKTNLKYAHEDLQQCKRTL